MTTKLLLLISIAAAFPLCAELSPAYVPISQLYRQADAVVIGHCESVRSSADAETSTINHEVLFSSAQVYKAEVAATFTVQIPRRPIAAGAPACGQAYWLLFLKHTDSNGVYSLSDPTHGIRPLPVFVPSTSAPSEGLSALEETLTQIATAAESRGAVEALGVLRDFDRIDPQTVSVLKLVSQRPDPMQRLLALETLARIEPSLYFGPFTEAFKNKTAPDGIAFARLCEVAEGARTTNQLGPLMAMTDWQNYPGLRECAMQGIRKLRAPASVAFLMRHLDDSQTDVAYLALITLSEITGLTGEYAPGFGIYRANHEEYKKRWKNWWVERGSVKYPDPQAK
jgi:hypothetical protein